MALMLTRSGLMQRLHGGRHHARHLLSSVDSHLHSTRESKFFRTGAVVLSSFGFGLWQGKFKDKGGAVVFGIPVDLLGAAVLHLAGLGISRTRAHNGAHLLHALGDGAIASFFTTTGYRVGERWTRGGSLSSGIAGIFGDASAEPVTGGSSIADNELRNLVRAR